MLADLLLPDADLKHPARTHSEQRFSGSIDAFELYSPEQALERVRVMLDAVIETYRLICERLFPALCGEFLYGFGPLRSEAVIVEHDNTGSLHYHWEPAEVWGTSSIVRFGTGELGSTREQFFAVQSRFATYGRHIDRWTFTRTHLNWFNANSPVTKLVSELLQADWKAKKRLFKI